MLIGCASERKRNTAMRKCARNNWIFFAPYFFFVHLVCSRVRFPAERRFFPTRSFFIQNVNVCVYISNSIDSEISCQTATKSAFISVESYTKIRIAFKKATECTIHCIQLLECLLKFETVYNDFARGHSVLSSMRIHLLKKKSLCDMAHRAERQKRDKL